MAASSRVPDADKRRWHNNHAHDPEPIVSDAKAGIGSAVNDTTRELGGTLGVAVIGSVFVSIYQEVFSGNAVRGIPEVALEPARESIGGALIAAQTLAAAAAPDAASSLAQVAGQTLVNVPFTNP